MKDNGVYEKFKKSNLPSGRKPIKCKWVFDIKRNGVFRARFTACGYSQVPGLDYSYQFSPVVNDVTFRIWITCVISWYSRLLFLTLKQLFYMDYFVLEKEFL